MENSTRVDSREWTRDVRSRYLFRVSATNIATTYDDAGTKLSSSSSLQSGFRGIDMPRENAIIVGEVGVPHRGSIRGTLANFEGEVSDGGSL
mmetsp:Transcript_4288/g.9382  ORF Transcript_4288/g.9382 Transcript_4288/m.9382 type:complete len:92 (+) Transcript_4288:232-507(+)